MIPTLGHSGFGLIIPSVADGVQPTARSRGAAVTPTQNAYGSYATLLAGASVTADVFAISINFNSNDATGTNRDTLATIGLDASGGTSFTDTIQHLLCSSAGDYYANTGGGGGGVSYFFPLFIKAGTSIGCKGAINRSTTLGTFYASCVLYCQPSHPERIKVGSFVQTFGATTASSSGTAITVGSVSEGAYVELGTLDKTIWGWEYGLGSNDTVLNNCIYNTDLAIGGASNKKIAILNGLYSHDTSEKLCKRACFQYGIGVSGDKVYGRSQNGPLGVAGSTTLSMCAYGVGG